VAFSAAIKAIRPHHYLCRCLLRHCCCNSRWRFGGGEGQERRGEERNEEMRGDARRLGRRERDGENE